MLYVNTVDVSSNDDGTVTFELECDGTTVRCEGAAWFEDGDNDAMLALFEEVFQLAEAGEEGYTIVNIA